jgi:hypothetical protein
MSLTPAQQKALEAIKLLARQLPQEKRKELTGLIGELSVCNVCELHWDPSSGYDAVDQNGNHVQIKTRRDSRGGAINPAGTVGRFTNFNFDYALYAELDTEFDVLSIYRIESESLPSLIKRKDNAITVHDFRKYGRVIFKRK